MEKEEIEICRVEKLLPDVVETLEATVDRPVLRVEKLLPANVEKEDMEVWKVE